MKKTLMVTAVFAVAMLAGFSVMANDAAPAVEVELNVESAEAVDLGFLAQEQATWLGLTTSTNLRQCPMGSQACYFNEQCAPGCMCISFCCEMGGGGGD
ncbi:MAG: hypothetical protein K0U98_02960 [Deltaproteobacteria bacterium]|nr:hypothetical protein [Deltaproteobacteria bacterium]